MRLSPLGTRKGRDARDVVLVRCHGHPAERWLNGPWMIERLRRVSAWIQAEDRVEAFDTSDDFWRWVRPRNALVVCMDADREMAMLGAPPNTVMSREPLRVGSIFSCQWRWAGQQRKVDVVQLGNWHHEGHYAGELAFWFAADWLAEWVPLVREHLGGRLCNTLAQQALLSFRTRPPEQHPMWHNSRPLYAFERAALAERPRLRISPESDCHYDKLYKIDFVAFYLSLMVRNPLPERVHLWRPEADSLPVVGPDRLALARVTLADGRTATLTDAEWPAADIDQVHGVVVYRASRFAESWARDMIRLRKTCAPIIAPSVKAVGVTLWAKLAQTNWGYFDTDDDGRFEMIDYWREGGKHYRRVEGKLQERDPEAWRPHRFPAIGVFVLAYAQAQMDRLINAVGREHVVYGHTDSLWTTRGVPGTAGLPGRNDIGGIDPEVVRDVEFRGGCRYVGGVLDAHPGIARAGTRDYGPSHHPAIQSMPHTAAFEERR